LRNVRRDVEVAQIVDELAHIVSVYRAEAACSRRIAHDHHGPLRVPRFPLPMSQIVFIVPAMLLVLVLMTLAGLALSMTCTGCLATDDNEAAHS
jgi:hypothetical protein